MTRLISLDYAQADRATGIYKGLFEQQMKLFGLFKEKPLSFPEFRDQVRLSVRRAKPGARAENTETGLNIWIDGKPMACNLRNLYNSYIKNPPDREELIAGWIETLVTEAPEQTWNQARGTLRPQLKHADFIHRARLEMRKSKDPDFLPVANFAGDVGAMVVREIGRSLFGVTQKQLEAWGVDLDTAMREAVSNMNLLSFPPITNEMTVGGSSKRGGLPGEVVGLMFEGDHLTATWFLIERFRDHIGLRLQGDFVVSIPNRNRLVAVRADEPGLISSMQQANRNYLKLPYAMTALCFFVSAASTGGTVEVYKGVMGQGQGGLDSSSLFAAGQQAAGLPNMVDAAKSDYHKPGPVDLSSWGGLTEPTEETAASTPPWNRGK